MLDHIALRMRLSFSFTRLMIKSIFTMIFIIVPPWIKPLKRSWKLLVCNFDFFCIGLGGLLISMWAGPDEIDRYIDAYAAQNDIYAEIIDNK